MYLNINKYDLWAKADLHRLRSNGNADLLQCLLKPNLSTFPEDIQFLHQDFMDNNTVDGLRTLNKPAFPFQCTPWSGNANLMLHSFHRCFLDLLKLKIIDLIWSKFREVFEEKSLIPSCHPKNINIEHLR